MGIKPKYEFGHGLSFTHFDYEGLKVTKTADGVQVNFTVTNSGRFHGQEIPQVYISKPKTVNYSD